MVFKDKEVQREYDRNKKREKRAAAKQAVTVPIKMNLNQPEICVPSATQSSEDIKDQMIEYLMKENRELKQEIKRLRGENPVPIYSEMVTSQSESKIICKEESAPIVQQIVDMDDYIKTIFEKEHEIWDLERSIYVVHAQMLKRLVGSHVVFTDRNQTLSSKKWFWKNKTGEWKEQPNETNKMGLCFWGELYHLYDFKRCQVEEQFCFTDPTQQPEQSQALSKKVKTLSEMMHRFCKNENKFQDRIIEHAEDLFYADDIPPNIQEEEVATESTKSPAEESRVSEKQPSSNKNSISSTMKRLVWNINIGEDIGKSKCMCCKTTDITQMSFHCGHVVANAKGGETIVSNLKPICQNCNSSMRTQNMNDFMLSLK